MGIEIWRWLWTGLAVAMLVGEIFSAGFFLLPFGIGAVAAALLAWFGVAVLAQWLVFFGVSLLALAYLRKFVSRQDDADLPKVGPNRLIDAQALVVERIDPISHTGMVRVEGETWRATTAGEVVELGTQVMVKEVRGTRLVVVPQSE